MEGMAGTFFTCQYAEVASLRARQLAVDCFPPVDVVFATTEEFESAATAKSPFLLSILEGGIIVYRGPAISVRPLRQMF